MVKIPFSVIGAMIAGAGNAMTLNPGNRGNSPSETPLQNGERDFIQAAMFPNMAASEIGSVPAAFVDWAQYAVSVEGLSGRTGGGIAVDAVPTVNGEPLLSYDANTGVLFNLGSKQ